MLAYSVDSYYPNTFLSGGGGVPLGILGGDCAAQFSKSWTFFKPKSVIFLTHSQTWPLRNSLK